MSFTNADYLFKKSLGIVASKGSNTAYGSENSGIARPGIIPSLQIYSQPIPTTAPNDYSVYSAVDNTYSSGVGSGFKATSNNYNYIVKYMLQLSPLNKTDSYTGKTSYRYNDPASSKNLLSNAIPSTYDLIDNTYNIFVYASENNARAASSKIASSDGTYPWVLDNEAGYLYFVSNSWDSTYDNNRPWIVFYRYEGAIGLTPLIQF